MFGNCLFLLHGIKYRLDPHRGNKNFNKETLELKKVSIVLRHYLKGESWKLENTSLQKQTSFFANLALKV